VPNDYYVVVYADQTPSHRLGIFCFSDLPSIVKSGVEGHVDSVDCADVSKSRDELSASGQAVRDQTTTAERAVLRRADGPIALPAKN